MVELRVRDTQTCVKHEILSRYLDTWGAIIVNGLRGSNSTNKTWRFVYVDCFSYLGRYLGDKENIVQNRPFQSVYGSPIIGLESLDKLATYAQKMGIKISINAILVERDSDVFAELKNTLRLAGYEKRVKETREFRKLKNGEVALVNADSTEIVDELLAYTNFGYTWAFYLLDPYGPSGIPYNFVKKIVSKDRHDVMINFIYLDLLKKAGLSRKTDLTPEQRQLVENWTRAYGNDKWKEIAREVWLAEEGDRIQRDAFGEYGEGFIVDIEQRHEEKEQKLVSAYRQVLQSMDPSFVTKLVNLRFSDRERTMFYLFLTTHDPTGALGLNKILFEAKLLEYELRYRLNLAKKTAPPPDQPFLMQVDIQVPEPILSPRPSPEEIERDIYSRLKEKSVTKKDIYRELVDTDYFPAEVDKAIRSLRRNGLVSFEGNLRHTTHISFIMRQQ